MEAKDDSSKPISDSSATGGETSSVQAPKVEFNTESEEEDLARLFADEVLVYDPRETEDSNVPAVEASSGGNCKATHTEENVMTHSSDIVWDRAIPDDANNFEVRDADNDELQEVNVVDQDQQDINNNDWAEDDSNYRLFEDRANALWARPWQLENMVAREDLLDSHSEIARPWEEGASSSSSRSIGPENMNAGDEVMTPRFDVTRPWEDGASSSRTRHMESNSRAVMLGSRFEIARPWEDGSRSSLKRRMEPESTNGGDGGMESRAKLARLCNYGASTSWAQPMEQGNPDGKECDMDYLADTARLCNERAGSPWRSFMDSGNTNAGDELMDSDSEVARHLEASADQQDTDCLYYNGRVFIARLRTDTAVRLGRRGRYGNRRFPLKRRRSTFLDGSTVKYRRLTDDDSDSYSDCSSLSDYTE